MIHHILTILLTIYSPYIHHTIQTALWESTRFSEPFRSSRNGQPPKRAKSPSYRPLSTARWRAHVVPKDLLAAHDQQPFVVVSSPLISMRSERVRKCMGSYSKKKHWDVDLAFNQILGSSACAVNRNPSSHPEISLIKTAKNGRHHSWKTVNMVLSAHGD